MTEYTDTHNALFIPETYEDEPGPEGGVEEWERARFLLDQMMDLAANFESSELTLALWDAQERAGIALERARARDAAG